jgi:hypothetical protein
MSPVLLYSYAILPLTFLLSLANLSFLRRFSLFSAFFDSSWASSELDSSSSASVRLLSPRSRRSSSSSSGLGVCPAIAKNFWRICSGVAARLRGSIRENCIWISPETMDFFLPERRDCRGNHCGSCCVRPF